MCWSCLSASCRAGNPEHTVKEDETMGKKKLYKSRDNRIICGVCGGIGEFFGIDATLVRLLMVIFAAVSVGVIFYIAAALIMPMEPWGYDDK